MLSKSYEDKPIPTLTVENIKTQKDTTIVKTLDSMYQDLIDTINNNRSIKHGKATKARAVRVIVTRIEDAITQRFGINARLVENSETPLAVMTTPPEANNVLAGNIVDNHKRINDFLDAHDAQDKVTRDDVDARVGNWVNTLSAVSTSLDAVDEAMGTTGIVMDLVNAKVLRFPADATTIILFDPVTLIRTVGLSASELTAITLHEIGHEFTHLEYASSTMSNMRILADSLVHDLNSGKAPLESLKIAYAKTYDDGAINDAKTVPTAVVGITSKYAEYGRHYAGNSYGTKDSERLADQFAMRFGVAENLGTALGKFEDKLGSSFTDEVASVGANLLITFIISALVSILSPALALGMIWVGLMFAGAILGIILAGYVFFALGSIVCGTINRGIDVKFPYDNPKRRILRMRHEMVRQLRNGAIPKSGEAAMLKSLDTLERVALTMSEEDENIYYRIIGKFFSYSKDQHEHRSIDNAIDELTNNDMHVAAAMMRNVKGA